MVVSFIDITKSNMLRGMPETRKSESLIQIEDSPKVKRLNNIKFIADGIMQTKADHPKTELIRPFEIHHCLENGLYIIRMCCQCQQDEKEDLEEGEEGEIHKYFRSIGLDLDDYSGKTHQVTHSYCKCCVDKIIAIMDEQDATADQTKSVLDS
ncbi:hypothetical protein ACFL3T_03325 [Patescibacteria group bacterium]